MLSMMNLFFGYWQIMQKGYIQKYMVCNIVLYEQEGKLYWDVLKKKSLILLNYREKYFSYLFLRVNDLEGKLYKWI